MTTNEILFGKDGLLSCFNDNNRDKLLSAILLIPEPIFILAPKKIINFVAILIGSETKKEKNIKILELNKKIVNEPILKRKNVVFITPPNPELFMEILPLYKNFPNNSKTILVIPKSDAMFELAIEINGFKIVDDFSYKKDEIYVRNLYVDFLNVENSYFLLPCINSFSRIFIQKDTADLYASARALAKIQAVLGGASTVITCGDNAERVSSLAEGFLKQNLDSDDTNSEIDTIVVFERKYDLASPFRLHSTAEQLIDDELNINFGLCFIDQNVGGKNFKGNITFTDTLMFFKNYRSKSIQEAADFLTEKQKQIHSEMDEIDKSDKNAEYKKSNEYTLARIQSDVLLEASKRIKKTVLFDVLGDAHSNFDGVGSTKVEIDLIDHFNSWREALKQICFKVGMSGNHFNKEYIEKQIIQEFGEKGKEALYNLNELGILEGNKEKILTYKELSDIQDYLRELLKLTQMETGDTTEESYFYYPLSACIASALVDSEQKLLNNSSFCKKCKIAKIDRKSQKPNDDRTRNVIFFFLGGVTLSEAGIIRSIGENSNGRYNFIIGGTEQVNGDSMIEQICPVFSD